MWPSPPPVPTVLAAQIEVMDPFATIIKAEVNGECVTIMVAHQFEASEFTLNVSSLNGSSSLLQGDRQTHDPDKSIEDSAPFVEFFVDDYTPANFCSMGQGGRPPCTTAALMDIYKMGDNSRDKENQWQIPPRKNS